jgi:hypothetical protein
MFSSVPPGKLWEVTLKCAAVANCCFFVNSSFTIAITLDATTVVLEKRYLTEHKFHLI